MPANCKIAVVWVGPELLAAVRTSVRIGNIAREWKPALDEVWAFLKANNTLRPGHNVFLYHHPEHRNGAMLVDFGVQIAIPFDRNGNVRCVETPAGEVASAVHIGPYERLGETHDAIHAWCAANNRKTARVSWETYGDWKDDPARLETTIRYLLA